MNHTNGAVKWDQKENPPSVSADVRAKAKPINITKPTLSQDNISSQTLNQGLRDGRWIGLLRDYFKAVTASSIGSPSLSGRKPEVG